MLNVNDCTSMEVTVSYTTTVTSTYSGTATTQGEVTTTIGALLSSTAEYPIEFE